MDLTPILRKAVDDGRFDPELAIYYLSFQNDQENGYFEVYSSWQFQHPLLPDSLNNKVWFIQLNDERASQANAMRKAWYANSLDDITTKTNFLNSTTLPFVFSSVRKSRANLAADIGQAEVLAQYYGMVNFMLQRQ